MVRELVRIEVGVSAKSGLHNEGGGDINSECGLVSVIDDVSENVGVCSTWYKGFGICKISCGDICSKACVSPVAIANSE